MPGDQADLAAQVSDLRDQVSVLIQLVHRLTLSQSRSDAGEWDVVEEEAQGSSAAAETPQSASAVPPIPDFCIRLCKSLHGGNLSSAERANRAWVAGVWAKWVIERRASRPQISEPCSVSNTIYVVLQCEGFECPLWVARSSDYQRIVRQFEKPSVSHAFASKAEARVYCLAAGYELPDQPYQWPK